MTLSDLEKYERLQIIEYIPGLKFKERIKITKEFEHDLMARKVIVKNLDTSLYIEKNEYRI